jgi:type IX secretion system PorP/SprF family membrane protein
MGKQETILRIGLLSLFLLPFLVSAQDVSFSQFYSSPLYLNPAFSGSVGVSRVSLQYRNQWQGFGNAFNTYNLGVDIPVEKLQGGVGLLILNDAQAAGSYQSLQLNVIYSVFLQVSREFRLHSAIQAGIYHNFLNPGKLVFPDNLDPFQGNHDISGEMEYLDDLRQTFPDFSAGLLLYSQKHFTGVAVHHLFEPEIGFFPGMDHTERLPMKFTIHAGSRLPVFLYGHHRKKFDISPQLVAQYQNNFGQLNYGLFATRYGITTGAWFRQNFGLRYDAVILLAGFSKNQWQINYSYDLVVSGLWGHTGGTSEISLVFLLKKPGRESHMPFFNFFDEEHGFQ